MIEASFRGRITEKGIISFRNEQDYKDYCSQYPGRDVLVYIKPMVKNHEKINLYAYYQAVIIKYTIKALTDDGWDGIDEDAADTYLKNACAKGIVYNAKTGGKMTFLKEKKRMTKDELIKFVTDCIYLLKERHRVDIPDSSSYLENKKTNFTRNFKKIN